MSRVGAMILLALSVLKVGAQTAIIDSQAVIPSHPRLLMTKADEQRILAAVATDPTWRHIQAEILLVSDSLIKLPPSQRVMEGLRLDANRWCLFRVFNLCYAWRTAHDRKYLDQAILELMAICHFKDWNPSHYLDVAELTMAAAIGYDWLYNDLPASSREVLRDAIVHKGILTSYDTSYHAYRKWLSVTNNWNQVCNTGISYGAMAIYETDPVFARQVIERSIRSIVLPMGAYGPDGVYAEGYGYWGYGTTYNVQFIDGLQKMFGTDFGLRDQQGFWKSVRFMVQVVGPTAKNFNYSDCAEYTVLQPAMYWMARELKDPSILWQQRRFLSGTLLREQMSSRYMPLMMIWGCGMDLQQIPAPTQRMWVGQGRQPVALMRTSWTDTNALFVGVKGGSPSIPHGHMDAGSFVMDALGVRWAMDFGYQNYNSLESRNIDLWEDRQGGQRWQVFRYINQVHNTLTVNDQEQRVKGMADLSGVGNASGEMMGAKIGLSPLYAGQLSEAQRGVAICEGRYVVVRDELAAGDSAAAIRWSLLTPASVRIVDANRAELTKDGKKLLLIVESKTPVKMRTWVTDPPPQEYDTPNPGTVVVGFTTRLSAGEKGAFNVYLVPEGVKTKPVKSLVLWR